MVPLLSMLNSSISTRHTSFILSSNKVAIIACQSNTLWCLLLKKSTYLTLHIRKNWFPEFRMYQNRYFRSDKQTKCTLFLKFGAVFLIFKIKSPKVFYNDHQSFSFHLIPTIPKYSTYFESYTHA
jgi:hypothetical protein